MTIKEAISHAKEVAERNRNQYKNCPADRRDIEHQTCEACAEQHEQLADWLEELQQYRAICTVEECRAALENRRAKKPSIGNDNGRKRKCCSVCGCFYSPTSKYCPKCGQAILYEDDET